ncbi:LV1 protein, partial [Tricholaema leucomelas]|nr:LV1 protein [Tricholaema leucomelas]
QAAVSQPASLSAKPGETVQISCSGLSSSSSYGVGWFQQKVPGTAPVTVIYYDNQRPSGIPSRFSGSASGTTGTLTITGVQAEDEAVYYCGGNDGSSSFDSANLGQTILISCSGSTSNYGWYQQKAAVSQPASLSASPGQTVQISCSGLGSSNAVGWHQQKVPGTAPVTVIYYNDKRPSGIPSRFSGSKSGTTGTLTITGVQAEDEAVYYCGGWDGSGSSYGVGCQP